MRPGLFDDWCAFDQIEPIGLERLIGIVTRGLYSLCQKGIDPLGGRLTMELLDPALKKVTPVAASGQTADEQRAIVARIAAAHNANLIGSR